MQLISMLISSCVNSFLRYQWTKIWLKRTFLPFLHSLQMLRTFDSVNGSMTGNRTRPNRGRKQIAYNWSICITSPTRYLLFFSFPWHGSSSPKSFAPVNNQPYIISREIKALKERRANCKQIIIPAQHKTTIKQQTNSKFTRYTVSICTAYNNEWNDVEMCIQQTHTRTRRILPNLTSQMKSDI